MRRSISFTCCQVRKLGWLWTERIIGRRSRNREIINERMMWWTVGWCNANYRFGDGLKAQCLFRSQHVWGQNTGGPGCCSYLEHAASTDYAVLYFSRPVFRLLFRHRISFQPFRFGFDCKNSWLVVMTLTRR